jgi:hypothetical protein
MEVILAAFIAELRAIGLPVSSLGIKMIETYRMIYFAVSTGAAARAARAG